MFERFLNYINKLFRNNKSESSEVNTVIASEEKETIVDDVNIKTIFQSKYNTINLDDLKNNINNISNGNDIYWVNLEKYLVDKKVDESHKTRPFLVMGSQDDKYFGFSTTSNLSNCRFSKNCFDKYKVVLSTKRYNLNKPSLVLNDRVLTVDKDRFNHYIDHINDEDLIRILKSSILQNKNKIDTVGNNLRYGDIFEKEDITYLIYQKDNSLSYGVGIKRVKPTYENRDIYGINVIDIENDYNYFVSENYLYKILFDKFVSINKSEKVIICDMLNSVDVDKVIQKRKDKKYKEKRKVKN